MANRQRRTATRITINFGENHTRQRQCLVEGLRSIGGVLAGHRIDHKQRFRRFGRSVNLFDLSHHVSIDMQATRRIDDQHIHKAVTRFAQRCFNNGYWLLFNTGGKESNIYLSRQSLQLLDRRRTINVDADHHDFLLFTLTQGLGQLGDAGGLTCALQTSHQNHGRWRNCQVQAFALPHDRFQLGLDDLDEHLPWREAARHFLTHCALAHLINKCFDHGQCHVGLKQRHAHFTQGVLDIVFCEFGLTGHATQAM